jgi:hypothetical protein
MNATMTHYLLCVSRNTHVCTQTAPYLLSAKSPKPTYFYPDTPKRNLSVKILSFYPSFSLPSFPLAIPQPLINILLTPTYIYTSPASKKRLSQQSHAKATSGAVFQGID